jgi:uncharacterized protein YcbX
VHVEALWRYPIKSLGGEALAHADLTEDGVSGDRMVHVRDGRGPVTGRSSHGLLTLKGSTGPGGVPRVDGHRWNTPAALAAVRTHAGQDAELVEYSGPQRFDVLNLLVATDGAVAAFGHDVRRLRPNLLVAGVPAEAERTWPGNALAIGEALIGVHSVRQRCIVTSINPDTGEQDLDVFRRIRREFGNELALNCWVIQPGCIRTGEVAELVRTDAVPERFGGWVLGAPYEVS